MADVLGVCTEDPGGLPWSERTPQAVGVFAVGLGLVVALQRHEFTHPNWGALVLGIVILPWILDIFGEPIAFMRDRRFELPMLATWSAIVIAGVMYLAVAYPASNDFSPFIITLLIGEMSATAGPRFGAAVCLVSIGLLIPYAIIDNAHGMYIWAFAFVIGWMGGSALRQQVQSTFELSQAQSKLAEQAVEDERHRLARDIHDLIAHSLAVTMLQMTGARLALKAGDTEEALAALEDAEAAGRSAMAEIHRTVGLLGAPDAGASQFATPSATELPRLVDGFRRAGLEIDVAIDGDLSAVPMATGLASYRLVQESLSNAVKHAPGASVRLQVSVTDTDIRINVVNPIVVGAAPSTSGGLGVRGMAERAALLGGCATAGNGDGTWKVAASLPLEVEPA
jgi:signal transduction histidine kinase